MIIFLGNAHSSELYKDFIEANKSCSPDIVVSCQYPHKIPASLIKSHIVVNIHYGLLPRYAGCNPIYWQMIFEDYAGVTLHYVDHDFDSGDIIDTFELPTDASIASEVYEALAQAGKALLLRNFKAILKGTAKRLPQDLTKRDYKYKNDINFKDAKYLGEIELPRRTEKHIRALNFKDKQYPIVTIKGRDYEVRAC